MNPCRVRSLRIAIAAICLCTASGAHAEIYRWVDAEGGVTYSNAPPAEPSQVRDLAKIEDISTAPADTRPKEAAAADKQKIGTDRASARPEPAKLPREAGAVPREPENAPRVTRGVQTEAVRDPCLTSADPKCHERNKDSYHPYLGYSGGVAQPVPAIGASSASGAGGAVGSSVRQ